MSDPEKKHIIDAYSFELSKVDSQDIRQQVTETLGNIHADLMKTVADNIGAKYSKATPSDYKKVSKALSMENTIKKPDTMKVGVIINQDTDEKELEKILKVLKEAKTMPQLISDTLFLPKDFKKEAHKPTHTFTSTDPVLIDALIVTPAKELKGKLKADTEKYLKETFIHFKPIMVSESIKSILSDEALKQAGVMVYDGEKGDKFVDFISEKRFWKRDILKW